MLGLELNHVSNRGYLWHHHVGWLQYKQNFSENDSTLGRLTLANTKITKYGHFTAIGFVV